MAVTARTVTKELIGLEDILTGSGSVAQTRGGTAYSMTRINASNLSYDGGESIRDKLSKKFEVITSIANLRLLDTSTESERYVNLTGYYGDGTDGGGLFYWDAASTATDNGGTIIKVTAIAIGRWMRNTNGRIHVFDFGSKWDGATDDSVEIQTAIDYMNASNGGIIDLPPKMTVCSIVMKENVVLLGQHRGVQTPSFASSTRMKAPATGGDVISGGTLYAGGIIGIQFLGRGASVASKGINVTSANKIIFSDLSFADFADEGLLVSGGVASEFTRIFAQDSLLDITRAAKTGVIHILGTDHWINTIEATASKPALTDANAYCGAIFIGGSNHFVRDLIGEISDFGIRIEANYSRFTACRADLNQGHGWEVTGNSNRFTICDALSNSAETANTYDGWSITGNTNKFHGCIADNPSNQHKYGFNDPLTSDAGKNHYLDCAGSGYGTSLFDIDGNAGSAVMFMSGVPKTFTAADATPSVSQYCSFRTGGVVTYTNFDDGTYGQQLTILASDASTLTNNATIKTNTGANKLMVVGKVYTFVNFNGIWYENE